MKISFFLFLSLFEPFLQSEYKLSNVDSKNYIEYNETFFSFLKKDNTMTLYHMPWCSHCKKALPLFEEASRYEIAKDFTFISVNCKTNSILCEDIDKYPTIKTVYHKKEILYEPGSDVKNILDFISKIKFNHFTNEEDSNILIEYRRESEIKKCIENDIHLNMFLTYNTKATTSNERIIIKLNESYSKVFEYKDNCRDVKNFIELYQYYPMKQLDTNYMNKIKFHKKENVIFFLTFKQYIANKDYLNELYLNYFNISIVFTYILTDNQNNNDNGVNYLINHFRPVKEKINFLIFKHNANDTFSFVTIENINTVKDYIDNKIKIKFFTGDVVHDFFYRIGISDKITLKNFKQFLLYAIVFLILLLLVLNFTIKDDDNDIVLQTGKVKQA